MSYQPNDFYARKAKQENFVARSVYKLEEIDKKHKLFHKNNIVLDLGASPGSWTQYASQKAGAEGRIFGIDLKPIEIKLPNVQFMVGDINALDFEMLFTKYNFNKKFDVVMSDMAPNTTSNRFTDQARSYELSLMALTVACKFLKNGGHFVCKIFDGEDAMLFRDEVKSHFTEVHVMRPKSVRESSKEIFVVGKKFSGS